MRPSRRSSPWAGTITAMRARSSTRALYPRPGRSPELGPRPREDDLAGALPHTPSALSSALATRRFRRVVLGVLAGAGVLALVSLVVAHLRYPSDRTPE